MLLSGNGGLSYLIKSVKAQCTHPVMAGPSDSSILRLMTREHTPCSIRGITLSPSTL